MDKLPSLDQSDVRILRQLQDDSDQSLNTIAEAANLSQNACWRRIKRLEEEGVIKKRVALLNAEKLGLGLTAFVTVRVNEHTEDWLRHFGEAVARMPEVLEFYRLSGDIDYLLKVQVSDIRSYDRFYKRLISAARLRDVSTAFSMEEIKQTTALPLPGDIKDL